MLVRVKPIKIQSLEEGGQLDLDYRSLEVGNREKGGGSRFGGKKYSFQFCI